MQIVIHGRIKVPVGALERLTTTTLAVRIEDVSEADRAAETIATSVRMVRVIDPPQLWYTIGLPTSAIRSDREYAVRLHLDLNDSGTITAGDYVSTKSYRFTKGDISGITRIDIEVNLV